MKKAGGGSIVLMSSIAGLRGAPGLAAYSATKGGVRLAREVGGAGHAADNIAAIRCIPASSPRRSGADPDRRRRQPRNAPIDPRERAVAVVPLTRVGEAQDIAQRVLFLCTRPPTT